MRKKFFLLAGLLISAITLFSQNSGIKVGIVGQPFSDFTLKTGQGNIVSMHELKGKNILIIVPRGKYADNSWCSICNYQYADFAEIELNQNVKKKYNLEILYLFPYGKDVYNEWVSDFKNEMGKIETWKNPADTINLTEEQRNWMMFTRKLFPKSFDFSGTDIPLPLPVLLDEKQEVSKGLDISRTEWDGAKTLQNIPAIYIIDKEGILRFKYISQNTYDRPSPEYVFEFLSKIVL